MNTQLVSSSIQGRRSDRPEEVRATQASSPPSSPYLPARGMTRMHALLGYVSALLSLFIVPEIFGPVAIILGAYTWKKKQGNQGIIIVILGIVFMLIGLYFTAYFTLGDLLPSP